MNVKKLTSLIIVACIALSCVFSSTTIVDADAAQAEIMQTNSTNQTQSTASSDIASSVQEGVIFHAWNWSYNNIKANLKSIADQGFTTIQTSPVQVCKEGTSGKSVNQWWLYYQPAGLSMETGTDNALGNKTQFQSMVEEAHKYGLKVIVDVVCNHLGNQSDGTNLCSKAYTMEPTIASQWLIHNDGGASDGSAFSVVRGNIGLPDLKTETSHVQQRALSLLKEIIDCGADGFRFDAAKHIETPDDGDVASQFWPTVYGGAKSYAKTTYGKDIYGYGEILNTPGNGRSWSSYTSFMCITDNNTGNDIRSAVESGNASGAANSAYKTGQNPNKLVLWAESHDTYGNDQKESTNCSTKVINQAWAMVASRKDATALYFARPNGFGSQLGSADKTAWTNAEVGAVNKFHNFFVGQSESLSSSGNFAYNERGTSGVVIINTNGGSAAVSVQAKKMANGVYTDQITGNQFTVADGLIKGQIGNTGIAVVYNAVTTPSNTISMHGGSFKSDTLKLTIGLINAISGTYQIDNGAIQNYTSSTEITIGSGVAYNKSITVTLTATDGTTTSDKVTYTFVKKDPNEGIRVLFDNSFYNWSSVYCYVYTSEGTNSNAAWPGVAMTKDVATGYYSYDVPEALVNGLVIFTENSNATNNRYPAAMEPGLSIGNSSKLFSKSNSWNDYVPTTVPSTTSAVTTSPVTTAPVTTSPSTTAPATSAPATTEPSDTTPVTGKVLLGDANLDNEVKVDDVSAIQKYCSKIITFSNQQLATSDCDQDGYVNIKDATCIQKYLAGIDTSTNIGKYIDADSEKNYTLNQLIEMANKLILTNDSTLCNLAYKYSDVLSGQSSSQAQINSVYKEFETAYNGYLSTPITTVQTTTAQTVPSTAAQTEPTTEVKGNYIYFQNTKNWQSVYAYLWSDGSEGPVAWPGTEMTLVANGVYKIELPNGINRVVFNNGSGDQTEDITISSAGQIYNNGSWLTYQ